MARAKEEIARLKEQLAKKSERKETHEVKIPVSNAGGKQQLFVNHFKTNFFAVEGQAQIGLKTNLALVAYLNKVSSATLAYSQHISNANKHFPWQEFGGDGMSNFLVALGELQSQLGQSAAMAQHAGQTMSAAIEKLQAENSNIHRRLQSIGEQHKAAAKAVFPMFQTRQQVIEKYAEWQVYNYKKDAFKAWDKKQLVEANLAKFEALQSSPQIREALTTYEATMKPLLGMIEDVEESRLHALHLCLAEICACSCIMGPWTGNFVTSVGDLNTQTAIQEFATKQSAFQVAHILSWKQELSAEFLSCQKPLTEGHLGRKLSITLSSTLARTRKPSLSPSRRPTLDSIAPPSPMASPPSPASFNVTDVIECSMVTPIILEATRDYSGSGAESDLIFQAGDLIKLLSPLGVDWESGKVEWCVGRDLSSGAQGRFPSNYVAPCKLR